MRPVEPGVTYETREEALDALAKTLRGIEDGTIVLYRDDAATAAAGPYTVEKMIDRYLVEHRDLSVRGRGHYRSMANAVLCKPGVGIGDVPVARLTTPMLRGWKLGLRAKGVTESMEKAAWATLSACLSWEVDMGRLPVSPATLPKARRTKRTRAAVSTRRSHTDDQPTWSEFARILSAIPRRCDRVMALVLGWGGLRLAEAAGLPPTCLTEAGALIVADTWVFDSETKVWVPEPVKSGQVRIVPIPEPLAALIKAEASQWQPQADRADLLFRPAVTQKFPGVYYTEKWRKDVWHPMRAATGLSTTTASLRGYAASTLVDAGATLLEVRDFLGHADTKTTETYYARARDVRDSDADRVAVRLQEGLTVRQRVDALWQAWEGRFGDPMTLEAP